MADRKPTNQKGKKPADEGPSQQPTGPPTTAPQTGKPPTRTSQAAKPPAGAPQAAKPAAGARPAAKSSVGAPPAGKPAGPSQAGRPSVGPAQTRKPSAPPQATKTPVPPQAAKPSAPPQAEKSPAGAPQTEKPTVTLSQTAKPDPTTSEPEKPQNISRQPSRFLGPKASRPGIKAFKVVFPPSDETKEIPDHRKDGRKSISSKESYNPFEHRDVEKPNSDFGSLAHLLKTSLGSGILAMPMAFKNAGLVLGSVGTIILGIICTHCIQMLVRSSHVLAKRTRVPHLDFAQTASVSFETGPPQLRRFSGWVNIIITTELLLSFILGNTVYVVFISQTMYQIFDYYFSPGIDIRVYIISIWLPLILMCMFRNLKSLVPFSIIANVFVVVSFGITLYYIFRDLNTTDSVDLVADPLRWPLFLSTVVFAIEGIGTVLPIEKEMKHPEHFIGGRCGIVYISMAIVVGLYGVIGFFGYLQYGEDTRGSITLNLPISDIKGQVVKILIAAAIFFTFALQLYVPINIIWDMIKGKIKEKNQIYCNIALRAGLVSLTIFTAIIIPNLEPVISLVGAICFSMLGLLFPSVIDTMTRWPAMGFWKWRLFKNIFIVFLSLLALVSGTYASIQDIISSYT